MNVFLIRKCLEHPVQTDSFNTGVFFCLFIEEFLLTDAIKKEHKSKKDVDVLYFLNILEEILFRLQKKQKLVLFLHFKISCFLYLHYLLIDLIVVVLVVIEYRIENAGCKYPSSIEQYIEHNYQVYDKE